MHVLALDTTTRAGGLALVAGGRVLYEHNGDPRRTHAERLPDDIRTALSSAGLTSADVDLFAVASGPGSFTGLRIGIATIQGLALVHRRRIVPVSALRALAQAAALDLPQHTVVGAWMDAHRRDVYAALYMVHGANPYAFDRLVEVDPPIVDEPESIWSRWLRLGEPPLIVVGDGAVTYAQALDPRARPLPPPGLASVIGRMAAGCDLTLHAVEPAGVQPLYVRRPDAEIARDMRQG